MSRKLVLYYSTYGHVETLAHAVVEGARSVTSIAVAILIGTPTRFGNMAAQMRNFLDQTGGLWARGALVGKLGGAFVSTGTGGGNETTLASIHTTLLHHGMAIVGLPYTVPELSDISAPRGGSPLGAGMLAGPKGDRVASEAEIALARGQGRHVAEMTRALVTGRSALLGIR